MKDDQLYISLYIKRRRLMTENARKNAESIESIGLELRDLENRGGVSQKTLDTVAYIPWR